MVFTPLFAYIDAGTGSMVIQTLAAGFFTMEIFYRQITGWVLKRIRPVKKDSTSHDA